MAGPVVAEQAIHRTQTEKGCRCLNPASPSIVSCPGPIGTLPSVTKLVAPTDVFSPLELIRSVAIWL
jgi:hypothetical protein